MAKKQYAIQPNTSKELRSLAELRLRKQLLAAGVSTLNSTSSPEDLLRIVHELQVHQVELEMQQEELTQSRIKLEDSLRSYTELYDFSPSGYLTLGRDSTIQQTNLTATKLLGIDRIRLLGMRFKKLVVPEDRSILDALLEKVFTKRVHEICEIKLLADVAQSSSKPLPLLSGRIFRLEAAMSDNEYASRIILSDITDQKVAEEGLRKTERKLRSITEQIGEVVVVADDKGVISNVSMVAETMFGLSHYEVVGHSFIDFMADSDIPAALKVLNDTLLNKTAKQVVEFKLKRKNGLLFDAAIHLQYYHDVDEIGFICIIWDITEQKKAQDEQHRLSRALLATNSCNLALIHATDEIELLQIICRIMVDIGGYRMAWVGYAEHDEAKSIRMVAQAGVEEGYIDTSRITWADNILGQGPKGTAIRTGELCTIRDIQKDPKFEPWRSDALKQGYASIQSLPLKVENGVFGALSVYSETPSAFDTEETTLLAALADNVAYGITMLRNREAKKRSDDELRQSEERFRILFEDNSAIMIIFDPDTGNINDANQAAADFYGWPIEVLRQMNLNQINTLTPEEIKQELKKWDSLDKWHVSFPHRRADGSVRDVEVFAKKIEIQGKAFIYDIIYDITDRKLQEQALKESEERFRMLFEGHSSIMLIIDHATGSIIDANSAAEDFYGWSIEELRRMSIQEINTESYDTVMHNMEEVKSSKRNRYLFSHRRADGSIRDIEVVSNAIMIKGKELLYSIINDITERKQLEDALKISEERFRKLFEDHSAIMILVDPGSGSIMDANHAACDFYGWSHEELLNMHMQQINTLPPEKLQLVLDKWKTADKLTLLFKHRKADGTVSDIEAYGCKIIIRGKAVIYLIIHDITERKRAAEESDQVKTAFLANISHEIRTPMNGIMGFSELLKEPHLTGEEQTEYVDLIHQSGQRMLNLINDLMDISKIDAKEAKPVESETSLNQLLRDLQAFFNLEANKKGLSLSLTKGLPDNESIITTDSGKLTQILTNLIQNSLKFTAKGGIDIGYVRKDGLLEFYVIDSGRGIPADQKEKIFDRFHQADISLTRAHEGSGLGLSISKAYVELLGGNIKVESVEGAGSTFTFTIPYKPAHLPTANCPPPTNLSSLSTAFCILIAEDDDLSTTLFKKNLKGEKITILCAENGWEAVELVQHHPEINLVLMDLKMPIMNGFEATKLIKLRRPDLPVIAQTAFTSTEDKEKAREAGCDSFITKPINKSELLELIHKLIKS